MAKERMTIQQFVSYSNTYVAFYTNFFLLQFFLNVHIFTYNVLKTRTNQGFSSSTLNFISWLKHHSLMVIIIQNVL